MSVHFFELGEGAFTGRGGRPGRIGQPRRAGRLVAVTTPAHGRVGPADARARPWHRYLGWGLTGTGAAMVPWLFVLAHRLPAQATAAHWNTVWVGLDSLEALGLISTGLLLRRRDARAGLTAAATASLLAIDAWFDVLTSAPGGERAAAIAMAAGAELPMAALCAFLAVHLCPRHAHEAQEPGREREREETRQDVRAPHSPIT